MSYRKVDVTMWPHNVNGNKDNSITTFVDADSLHIFLGGNYKEYEFETSDGKTLCLKKQPDGSVLPVSYDKHTGKSVILNQKPIEYPLVNNSEDISDEDYDPIIVALTPNKEDPEEPLLEVLEDGLTSFFCGDYEECWFDLPNGEEIRLSKEDGNLISVAFWNANLKEWMVREGTEYKIPLYEKAITNIPGIPLTFNPRDIDAEGQTPLFLDLIQQPEDNPDEIKDSICIPMDSGMPAFLLNHNYYEASFNLPDGSELRLIKQEDGLIAPMMRCDHCDNWFIIGKHNDVPTDEDEHYLSSDDEDPPETSKDSKDPPTKE